MTIPEDRYRDMYFMAPSWDSGLGALDIRPIGVDFGCSTRADQGPCYMPDLSGVLADAARSQIGSIDFGRWYMVRSVHESDEINAEWPDFSVGGEALERDGASIIPYLYGLPRISTTTREALRREMAETLINEVERHQRVAFERALMRRVAEARFRRAYMGRQFANMVRAYHGPDYGRLEANAFFGMFPVFEDEAQAREWFESMGAAWPEEGPNPWNQLVAPQSLKSQAKTLRERAFATILQGPVFEDNDDGVQKAKLWCAKWEGSRTYELDLKGKGLRNVLAALRRDPEARRHLATLPISKPAISSNANDELAEPLQDLADIIVHEIKLAYEEDYYPRPVDVDALADEHIAQVMKAMQREIDREHRGKRVPKLEEDLPWERQVALAERRRHWFAKFGITPKSWRTGRWSLWKVPNEPFPEGYPSEKRYNLNAEGTPVDVANDQDAGDTEPEPGSYFGEGLWGALYGRGPFPAGRADMVIIDEPHAAPTTEGQDVSPELRTITISGVPIAADETESDADGAQ